MLFTFWLYTNIVICQLDYNIFWEMFLPLNEQCNWDLSSSASYHKWVSLVTMLIQLRKNINSPNKA